LLFLILTRHEALITFFKVGIKLYLHLFLKIGSFVADWHLKSKLLRICRKYNKYHLNLIAFSYNKKTDIL